MRTEAIETLGTEPASFPEASQIYTGSTA